MKDSLKEFIRKHRDDFDHRLPGAKVWRAISKSLSLDGSRAGGLSLSVWRAAALLFFGASVYLFLLNNGTFGKKADVAAMQAEFYAVESFYKDQIAEKVAFLQDYEDDRFTQDLQKLDAMYQVLREDLKAKPSEKVKDAIVLNMLIRIDLLNQQIKQVEDGRKRKGGRVSSI